MSSETNKLALRVSALTKSFDGVKALDAFNLEVHSGEIVALIGPNGAGKTTLFNIITGFLKADDGIVEVDGKNVTHWQPHRMIECGIARTFQNLRLIGGIPALANVQLAFHRQRGERILRGLTFTPLAVANQESANRETALGLLSEVGLEDKAHDLARNLSYGQQKLLTMACILATGADILLLDEPVAGVAPALISQILELVRQQAKARKTIILIEHNVQAVEEIAERAVFMDSGRKIAEGPPSEVMKDERVLEAYLE